MTTHPTPEALAACPFCGNSDSLITHHEPGTVLHPWYRIECDNCGAKGPGTDQGTHAEQWNRRTLSAEQQKHSATIAERDSLRAEVERLRPKWLPIESAPKDGALFLCWVSAVRFGETDEGQQYQQDASQVDFCSWRVCDESPTGGYFDACCGQIADLQHITHWMPLPPPPVAEGV